MDIQLHRHGPVTATFELFTFHSLDRSDSSKI